MNSCVKDILQDDFWIMPQTPEYIEEGIPYITSKNIKNGKIDFSKVNYISQEVFEKISKNRPILVGDILISMIGTLGETAEVTVNDGVFYGQNMFLVRLDESKVDKRYFLNYFKSNYVKRALAEKQNQSTQKYLKANHIEDLYIPVPTVEQQRNAACILDKISEMISFRKQQLQQLDELVKARFVELFGDPMTNSKEYPLKKYGDLFELNAGGTPSKQKPEYWDNGTISWIGSNMCQNSVIYENDGNYITEEGFNHSSARMFPVDTVLIALVGATIGKTALLKFETTTNQNVLGVRGIRESGFTPEFVFYYTQGLYQKFLDIGDGGFAMASKGFISELPIPIVDLSWQNEFADFVEQVNKSKFVVQKALDEAQTLFDSLMQEYFG